MITCLFLPQNTHPCSWPHERILSPVDRRFLIASQEINANLGIPCENQTSRDQTIPSCLGRICSQVFVDEKWLRKSSAECLHFHLSGPALSFGSPDALILAINSGNWRPWARNIHPFVVAASATFKWRGTPSLRGPSCPVWLINFLMPSQSSNQKKLEFSSLTSTDIKLAAWLRNFSNLRQIQEPWLPSLISQKDLLFNK